MNRDRSRSRLSSPGSKSRIKLTISEAMGRPKAQQISAMPRPRRSQSTKSLKSFNGSMMNSHAPYGYSSTSRKLTINQLTAPKLKPNDVQTNLPGVKSWEWWHHDNCKLITQEKIKQTERGQQKLKYFAYQDPRTLKKKIILAVQNNQIFPGHSELGILALDPVKYTIDCVQKLQEDKICAKKQSLFLFFEQNDQKKTNQKSLKSFLEEQLNIRKNKVQKVFESMTKCIIQGNLNIKFFLMVYFFRQKSQKMQTLEQILRSDQKARKKLF